MTNNEFERHRRRVASVADQMIPKRRSALAQLVRLENGLAGQHAADFVSTYVGFGKIDDEWIEISKEEAQSHLQYVLQFDLAYRSEMMGADIASKFAQILLDELPAGMFFTNAEERNLHLGNGMSWMSITSSTFDTGIIALADGAGLIVWVFDED